MILTFLFPASRIWDSRMIPYQWRHRQAWSHERLCNRWRWWFWTCPGQQYPTRYILLLQLACVLSCHWAKYSSFSTRNRISYKINADGVVESSGETIIDVSHQHAGLAYSWIPYYQDLQQSLAKLNKWVLLLSVLHGR